MGLPSPSPELLRSAQQGDAAALGRLLDQWLPTVLAWCKRLGGPTVDANDATQDVLVLVMDRVGQVWSPSQFRPWLFGVTRRVLARHRRGGWVKRWWGDLVGREAVDHHPGPERTAELSQTAARVQRALQSLSVAHQEVLVLCDLESRTDDEVAELLAVPSGTVKSRLRRARAAFRTAAIRHGLGPEVERVSGGAS
ncbi:MAG: RNA polymerase sigma factor [Myxococcota bacterium]